MQFSFWPSNDRPWDETLELAQWAEQSGLLSFWYADHFMSQSDDITVPGDEPALECWTVLTALGALVPRLRLVSMVSPVTIHHPVVLAKRVATLDLIARGRVVLGLGAGWQENEHAAYGVELPPPGPRVDRFAEAIEVVHQLLTQDRSQFSGQYYNLTDATFVPRPERLPLLVGTAGPAHVAADRQVRRRMEHVGRPRRRARTHGVVQHRLRPGEPRSVDAPPVGPGDDLPDQGRRHS